MIHKFKGEVHSENYFFFYWLKLFSSALRDEQKNRVKKYWFLAKLWMFEKTADISIFDILKNLWRHLGHKCQNKVILRDIPIKYIVVKQEEIICPWI